MLFFVYFFVGTDTKEMGWFLACPHKDPKFIKPAIFQCLSYDGMILYVGRGAYATQLVNQ